MLLITLNKKNILKKKISKNLAKVDGAPKDLGNTQDSLSSYPTVSLQLLIPIVSKNEDVISLNPQFLNFLMSPEKADTASKEFTEALNLLASHNLRRFDPFDRVVLSNKGIDNPILTSFRTLAKTNNSLSDTFKIIHSKFLPDYNTNKNAFFMRKQADGSTKSYLINPPPDLSGVNDSLAGIKEEYLYTNDNDYTLSNADRNYMNMSLERSQETIYPSAHRGYKVATAKPASRMKLNESMDKQPYKSRVNVNIIKKDVNYETLGNSSSVMNINNSTINAQRHIFDNSDLLEYTAEMFNDASIILPE
jgi:hypothetical protein